MATDLEGVDLMLPPFGGHLKLAKQGVHHAEIKATVPGGIPPTNH